MAHVTGSVQASLDDKDLNKCPAWCVDKAKKAQKEFDRMVGIANKIISEELESDELTRDGVKNAGDDLSKVSTTLANMLREAKRA